MNETIEQLQNSNRMCLEQQQVLLEQNPTGAVHTKQYRKLETLYREGVAALWVLHEGKGA